MKSKRKTATPVAETGIFTEQLASPEMASFQTEDDLFNQTRQGLEAFRTEKRSEPDVTVSFNSLEALVSVLTPRRCEIIAAVKAHGGFHSIEELANSVSRDRGTVSRDLKALASAGLIKLREAVLPGHGKRSEIVRKATRLTLELSI